jgi:hypothetical protein
MFAATKSGVAQILQQGRAAFVIRRQQRVAIWLVRDIAALRRRRYISHHEHSAMFLSSQLISDSLNVRITYSHNRSQRFRAAEKCEPIMTSVFMTYLTIAGMLALTTFPVLVPAIITAGHAIRRRFAPARSAAYLPTVSRRLTAAAA